MFSLLTTLARTRYYYDSSDYGYNYNYSTTGDEGSAIAVLIVLLIFLFALIAGYVVTSLFFAGIFKKAGISTTAAWIPFYNNWKFFELGGQQGFLSLLAFVPFVGAIITGIFAIIAAFASAAPIFMYLPVSLLFMITDHSTIYNHILFVHQYY